MGKHTSQFQKGKYTELKALLMMMTEFYIYSGHECRMDITSRATFLALRRGSIDL